MAESMLVHYCLEQSALRFPEKTAIVHEGKRFTYEQINLDSESLASLLIETGLIRQGIVAILLDNSIESVISMFGVLKAGGIFVMLSHTMKHGKLNYILRDSGATTLITHMNKQRVVEQSLENTTALKTILLCSSGKEIDEDQIRPQLLKKQCLSWTSVFQSRFHPTNVAPYHRTINIDLATIIYTSGSTGDPKGVMSSHHNVLSAAKSIIQYLNNNEDDIVLNALPLSFDYGLYQIIMVFLFGGTVILETSFVYPYKVLEQIGKEKVTGFPIVPTMMSLLFQMDDLLSFDFSTVRYLSNTAAALPEVHIRKFAEIFPNVQIYSMYGLTECKRVSYLPPEDVLKKPGSVGIPIPNEDVMIFNDHGKEVAPGEIGELVVRGANVMQGYWNAPEETRKTFRKGRYNGESLLYTGDYFKMDGDGYLYFVSRKDDLIKTKGERVSPKEVENALYEIDDVIDAAVVGVQDDILGQSIVAFIVSKDPNEYSEKKVKLHCRKNLESFMIPKYIFIKESFLRITSGKIDKGKLEKEAAELVSN